MQNISFLIGAGFSCSAGFPTANGLSNKIAEAIKQKLDNDPIRMFYNAYCKANKAFDYESFYDWIIGWGRLEEECFKSFNDDIFNRRFEPEFKVINQDTDLRQLRTEAITELNKLVTFNLSDVTVKSSCYAAFADFISRFNSSGCAVDIYTLNHDLLMEELLNGRVDYSDGYSKGGENSIFYGFGSGKYKEASVFDGCFSSNTRLYKLHGSLDRYWIGELVPYTNENGESLSVKVDRAYDVTPEFRHKTDSNKVIHFSTNYTPDFLTGVETKRRYYRFSPYNTLFDNFKEISNTLVLCLLLVTVSAMRE